MKRIIYALIIVVLIGFFLCISITDSTIVATDDYIYEESENIKDPIKDWRENHPKVRGIYVTGPTAGTERMDEIIDLISDTELNAIVLDVKDDNGNISFIMDNEMAKEIDACIPYIKDIDSLISKLKKNDIYVIARIPCFKDPTLAAARPDLALCTATGEPVTDANGNAWVNPCEEEVWNYIISVAESCADIGFDEIQFDYVRFPVGQNSEDAVYSVPLDDSMKEEYINSFLKRAVENLHDKGIPVTADVFGTIIKSQEDAAHIGQNYTVLATELDVLCPMIYPSHYANGEFDIEIPDAMPYETILAALTGSKSALVNIPDEDCAIIRPWLQAFTATWVDGHIEYDGDAIKAQIQAVYDSGYDEWILWNSKSVYSSDGLVKE